MADVLVEELDNTPPEETKSELESETTVNQEMKNVLDQITGGAQNKILHD
jgi:hypothetical protein